MKRKTIFFIFLILFTSSSLLFGKDSTKKKNTSEKTGEEYETLVLINYGVAFSANGFLNGTEYNSATLGGIFAQATVIRGYKFGAFFQLGYFLPTGISTITGEQTAVNTIFTDEIRTGMEASFGATFRYKADPLILYVGLGPHIGMAVKNFDTFLNGGLGAFGRATFTLTKNIRVNAGIDISYNFLGTATTSDIDGEFVHNFTGSMSTGWSFTF